MKKIGIITQQGGENFGNKLQNFAVEQIISSLGFAVESIIEKPNKKSKRQIVNSVKKFMNMPYERKKYEIKRVTAQTKEQILYHNLLDKRRKTFSTFSENHLHPKEYNINKEIGELFHCFVVGSDIIWSPNNDPYFALAFFAPENKRVAFAPSFGVSVMPEKYKKTYAQGLSGFRCLSVREDAGARIIKELTGRDAEVLLDPTMIIKKEKWCSMASPSKNKPNENYLLKYMVGKKQKKEWEEKIRNFAKKNNLKVISLADIRQKKLFNEGPKEFIDFIKDAKIIFTDSFHGVIFSILFEKPFVAFKRLRKVVPLNSRIETLLKKFRFENRFVDKIEEKDIFNVDFSHTKSILEEERNKSIDYLKKALNCKELKE